MKNVGNMDCKQVRSHWSIFHDSEGDAEIHFGIEQHLESCEQCRKWFNGQERIERSLTTALNQAESGNESLVNWDQVLADSGVVPRKSSERLQRRIPRSLITLVAIAASLFVFISFWVLQSGSKENIPSLLQESIAVHRFVATESLRPDFESTSDIEVDRYLVRRASFPVRCPPRKDSGFEVNGAGMYQLDGQDVAYVVGSVDSQPISVFVLPKDQLELIPNEKRPKMERQLPERNPSPYRTLSAKSLSAFFQKMLFWQCFTAFVSGSVGRFSELDDHERFWASVNRRMLASGFSSLRIAIDALG